MSNLQLQLYGVYLLGKDFFYTETTFNIENIQWIYIYFLKVLHIHQIRLEQI